MASSSDNKLHLDDTEVFASFLGKAKKRVAELEELLVRKYEENEAVLQQFEVVVEKKCGQLDDDINASAKKQSESAAIAHLTHERVGLCEARAKDVDGNKRRLERQKTFVTQELTMIEQETKIAEREGAEAMEKLTDMKNAMKFYEEDLALRFKKNKDGDLTFVFTNINLYEPDEEYSFSLNLDKDKIVLKDCSPDVGDLSKLVAELKVDRNLGRFVCQVRQRFCAFAVEQLL